MIIQFAPTSDELIAGSAFNLLFAVGFVYLLWTLVRRRAGALEAMLWIGGGAVLTASAATCLENALRISRYANGAWRTATRDAMIRDFADVQSHWFAFALLGATFGLLIVACMNKRRPPHRRRTGWS